MFSSGEICMTIVSYIGICETEIRTCLCITGFKINDKNYYVSIYLLINKLLV